MKKTIAVLAIFGLFLPVLALAQEDVELDANVNINTSSSDEEMVLSTEDGGDEVTAAELEVSEPKVLPNSPWYWAKSLWRSIKLWVTLDPVKRAEKRLEIANERLLELKALLDQGEISEDRSEMILEKYDKEIEKLTASLEKIKDKTEEKADQLLEKVVNQEFVRQRLMTQLKEKIKTETVERIKERSLERLGQVIDELEEQNIEEKINGVFSGGNPLEVKNLHNLQVLENLKEKVSEQAQAAIEQAQTNALKRLGESFREMNYGEKIEKVAEYLEGLGDDGSTEEILEQVEEEITNSLPLLTNIINRARIRVEEKVQNQGTDQQIQEQIQQQNQQQEQAGTGSDEDDNSNDSDDSETQGNQQQQQKGKSTE